MIFFEVEMLILDRLADERYDKSFQISVSIDGITLDRKIEHVLIPEGSHNRYFHLIALYACFYEYRYT